jgi:hypothetical protein
MAVRNSGPAVISMLGERVQPQEPGRKALPLRTGRPENDRISSRNLFPLKQYDVILMK